MSVSKLCRGCMKVVARNERNKYDQKLSDMFTFCTSIQMTKEDALPNHFCLECIPQIKTAYVYIQKALKVDDTLKDLILENRAAVAPGIKKELVGNEDTLTPQTDVNPNGNSREANIDLKLEDAFYIDYADAVSLHDNSTQDSFIINVENSIQDSDLEDDKIHDDVEIHENSFNMIDTSIKDDPVSVSNITTKDAAVFENNILTQKSFSVKYVPKQKELLTAIPTQNHSCALKETPTRVDTITSENSTDENSLIIKDVLTPEDSLIKDDILPQDDPLNDELIPETPLVNDVLTQENPFIINDILNPEDPFIDNDNLIQGDPLTENYDAEDPNSGNDYSTKEYLLTVVDDATIIKPATLHVQEKLDFKNERPIKKRGRPKKSEAVNKDYYCESDKPFKKRKWPKETDFETKNVYENEKPIIYYRGRPKTTETVTRKNYENEKLIIKRKPKKTESELIPQYYVIPAPVKKRGKKPKNPAEKEGNIKEAKEAIEDSKQWIDEAVPDLYDPLSADGKVEYNNDDIQKHTAINIDQGVSSASWTQTTSKTYTELPQMAVEEWKDNLNKQNKPKKEFRGSDIDIGEVNPLFDNICNICNKTFSNGRSGKTWLGKHMIDVHERERKLNRKNRDRNQKQNLKLCSLCKKPFAQLLWLERHMEVIHGSAKIRFCEYCPKMFESKDQYYYHISLHDEYKNFACNACGRRFRKRQNLAAHVLKHSEKDLFICDTCNISFKEKDLLISHLKMHVPTQTLNNKRILCTVCGKGFGLLRDLEEHSAVHTGAKPHSCSQCGFRTAFRSVMSRHTKRHSGDLRYRCKSCSKAFVDPGDLGRHVLTHTNERPFKCPNCTATFTCNAVRTSHMVKVHHYLKEDLPKMTMDGQIRTKPDTFTN